MAERGEAPRAPKVTVVDVLDKLLRHGEVTPNPPLARADLEAKPGDRQVGGSHYTEVKIQHWDVVDAWGLDEDHYRATALKYLYRAGRKGSYEEDLRKAIHYLEKAIERRGQREAEDR